MTDRDTAPRRTRVALRIADGPGPAYLAAATEAVLRVDGAEVVLLIATSATAEGGRTRRRIVDCLDMAYERFERSALPGVPRALSAAESPALSVDIPIVRRADHPTQAEALSAAQVDVLIDLVPNDRPAPLPVPPAGYWRLRFADGIGTQRRTHLSRPVDANELVESALAIHVASGEAFEAEVGVSAVQRIGYGRSRDAVYWRAALLPARRLARLVSGASVPSDGIDAPVPSVPAAYPEGPSARAMPPFIGLVAGLVRRVVERSLFRSGWVILVRPRGPDQPPPRDLTGFRPVHAPRGRFFADPFVTATEDGPRLYVEDCPDGVHEGRITVLQPDAHGVWTTERVVLDDLPHRAYPHALRIDDGWLVTPDGARSGGVDLFIDGGKDRLRHIGRCLEGIPASDPTVLWHDGRYWMFVTVTGHGMAPWDELHLYSAESIPGVWHPHPRNPVVSDVRRARPAGRIFQTGDGLVRPGQDCSVEYGRRIVLSAITSLSTTTYEEHPISSIEPAGIAGIRRTHTYTFDGSIEALDGYRRVLRRPMGLWPRRAPRWGRR